jgi:hypothetical protein
MLCKAIWSQKHTVQKCVDALSPDSSIGATQFLLTDEEHTPFSWVQ